MDIEKHRNTPIRKVLLEILTRATKPSAQVELHALLVQRGLSAHKTTLYRILDDLLQHRIISQTTFGDGVLRFELTRAHHHHVVCESCHRVEDVQVAGDLAREEQIIARKVKFRNVTHTLEFFGTCEQCVRKSTKIRSAP